MDKILHHLLNANIELGGQGDDACLIVCCDRAAKVVQDFVHRPSRERSFCGMCWAKRRISFLRRLSFYDKEDVLVRRAHKQVDRLVNALSVAYFGRTAESHFCGGCLLIPGRMY